MLWLSWTPWGRSQEVQASPLDVAFWNAAWASFGMTEGGSHPSGSSLSLDVCCLLKIRVCSDVILSRLLASQPLVREKRAPIPLECLSGPDMCHFGLEGRVCLVTAQMELGVLELLVWWQAS